MTRRGLPILSSSATAAISPIYRGQQEQYFGGIASAAGYNDPDGYWYYLVDKGYLYEFTPPYSDRGLRGVLIAELPPAFYDKPSRLFTNHVQIPATQE